MGKLFGRGWAGDIGKTWLNAMASPLEMLSGQNFYDPEVEGSLAKGMVGAQDSINQVGSAVAPQLLNMALPGSGTAVQAGRMLLPNGGQYGYPVQDPQRQAQMPDLSQFSGPSHEQGGIPLNDNTEIEKKETVDTANKYVYSDTLKVPGTKKTFAEQSKKYETKDTDDDITRRTNKKMLDRLRGQQEEVKAEKMAKLQSEMNELAGGSAEAPLVPTPQTMAPESTGVAMPMVPPMDPRASQYQQMNQTMDQAQQMMQNGGPMTGESGVQEDVEVDVMRKGGYYTPGEAAANGAQLTSNGSVYGSAPGNWGNGRTQYQDGGFFGNMFAPQQYTADNNYGVDMGQSGWEDLYLQRQQADMDGTLQQPQGVNWQNIGNQMMQGAPIAYNMWMGQQDPDYYEAIQNPEYDKSIDLVADREYDIDSQLADAQRTFDQSSKFIKDASGGNAAVALANIQGAQRRADRAKQQVRDLKTNMDNQLDMQEAQFRGNMGAQWANELQKAQLYGLQTDAARRAFTGQGVQDMSEMAQRNQLMRNQEGVDAQRMQVLQQMYGHFPQFAQMLSGMGGAPAV